MKKCLLAFVCGFSLTAQTKIDWNTQLKNIPTRVTNAEMVPNKDTNGGYVGRDTSGNATIPGAVTAVGFTSSDTTHTSLVQLIPGLNTNFASVIGTGLWGMFLDSGNANKLTRQDSMGNKVVIEGAGGGGGGGIYTQPFTSATSVSLTHNMNLSPITGFALECFDGSSNLIYPSSAVAASANAITVTFAVSTTGSCTVVGTGATTGGGGGGGIYTQAFTSATSVSLTHNMNLSPITGFGLECFDGSSNLIYPSSAVAASANAITVTFAVSTTGSCTVLGTGATTGGGAVTSVFTRTGAVVAQTGDYTAAQVGALNDPGANGIVKRTAANTTGIAVAADFPTLNQSTTGNAATATALATAPTQCTGGQFATGVAASGNANCATPGGGGNVSGPGMTTSLYVPQWNGTTGTLLGAGLPVATTSTANALVETGAGGTINANFVPTLNQSTTGNATTATTATNVAGGGLGSIPYQSAAATTAMLAGNTAATDQVLVSHGTGTVSAAPALSNAPALSAANMTAFPTLNQSTTGNAATATALAAAPTQCTGGQFATGVAASGNANCATPGGGGNVSGPGTTTNLYVPQWSGTTGTSLAAGLPVATTSTVNSLVETGAGGTINANFVPTLNQSTTGTASNVTGIVLEANGGTGAANVTGVAGHYLRSNGTHYVDNSIQAADVPTLNQSTTGNATTATTATNVAGGGLGSIPYQSAAATTAMLAGNTAATDQVLVSHGTGTVSAAPTFSNAPALSAANMTAFPTLNQSTTGNAATATALATAPTQCTGGQFATGIAAGGNANCSTPASGGITQLTGDVAAGPGSGSQAATIQPAAVTLAKMANLAANSIMGNNTGLAATPLALTAAQTKTLLALTATDVGLGNVTNNVQTQAAIVPNTAPAAGQVLVGNAGGTAYAPVAMSGNVAISSTGATTIQPAAVTLAMQANLAANSIMGNNTGSAATPLALTAAQTKTLLAITPTDAGLSNVTNNAQTQAAIVPNTAPAAGQVLVGNAGGTAYAPVAMSGNVAIASTGATTIQPAAVTLAMHANLAANSIIGNNTGSAAAPIALTVAQVNTLLGTALIIAKGTTAATGAGSISNLGSIAAGSCGTLTVSASGVATTDAIGFSANGSIKALTGFVPATTGGLTIAAFPTANNVNFDVCNWTAGAVTPGNVQLNWRVDR